jgi:hypothetical protein
LLPLRVTRNRVRSRGVCRRRRLHQQLGRAQDRPGMYARKNNLTFAQFLADLREMRSEYMDSIQHLAGTSLWSNRQRAHISS